MPAYIAVMESETTLDSLDSVSDDELLRRLGELVAELSPRPDAPPLMRKLPQRRPVSVLGALLGPNQVWRAVELGPDGVEACPTPMATHGLDSAGTGVFQLGPDRVQISPPEPSRPAVVEPLSPDRYKVHFTASARLRDKLERLSALMRPEVPDGDLAAIIEKAVTEKLERLEARRYARTSAPRKELGDTDTSPTSRHIPAAVKRAVRERDGNRCGYVDERGRRCSERDRLEFHHRHPFGMGGDHSPANLRLLCRVPDYAELGLVACVRDHGEGKRVGIIRALRERRAVSPLVGTGWVRGARARCVPRRALSWPGRRRGTSGWFRRSHARATGR